jgi:hypothetical protein
VAGRAVCSSRIPGEDPSGDGPGAVLMSSFGVEILRPRCRPSRAGHSGNSGYSVRSIRVLHNSGSEL